jgi:excisionase family DNA binding protein
MNILLTATEVAERLGVSDQAVLNWIKDGRVPGAQKVGRTWVIPEDSLELIERPSMGRPPKESNGNGREG